MPTIPRRFHYPIGRMAVTLFAGGGIALGIHLLSYSQSILGFAGIFLIVIGAYVALWSLYVWGLLANVLSSASRLLSTLIFPIMPKKNGRESGKVHPSDLSSRFKDIYIELHDYSYFHSPSEIGNVDERFIGRRRLIDKLKSLLIDSETRSGAYLVTGYRGMGKSSFVNKAIYEISPKRVNARLSSSCLRILFGLLFLCLFVVPIYVMVPVFLWALGYLIYTDSQENDVRNNQFQWWPEIKSLLKCIMIRPFVIGRVGQSSQRLRILAQDIYLGIFIYGVLLNPLGVLVLISGVFLCTFFYNMWLSKGWLKFLLVLVISIVVGGLALLLLYPFKISDLGTGVSFHVIFGRSIFAFLLLLLFNFGWSRFIKAQAETEKESIKGRWGLKVWKSVVGFFRSMWESIGTYFKGKQKVCIRISLGYDDLREIDILRLVARSIQDRYEKFLASFWLFKFAKFVVLLSFVVITYYSVPIYTLSQSFKEETGFIKYLPSQGSYLLDRNSVADLLSRDFVVALGRDSVAALDRDLVAALHRNSVSLALDPDLVTVLSRDLVAVLDRDSVAALSRCYVAARSRILAEIAWHRAKAAGLGRDSQTERLRDGFVSALDRVIVLAALNRDSLALLGPDLVGALDRDSVALRGVFVSALDRVFVSALDRGSVAVSQVYDSSRNTLQVITNNTAKIESLDAYLTALREGTPGGRDALYFPPLPDSSIVRKATIYVDLYTAIIYMVTREQIAKVLGKIPVLADIIPGLNNISVYAKTTKSIPYKVIPDHPDYLLWLYFVILFLLFKGVFRFQILGIVTHGAVRRRLKELSEVLDAQVTQEQGASVSGSGGVLFKLGARTKTYPIADAREIEKRLIGILDDVSRIPRVAFPPEFIITFDELDKIEPHENLNVRDKEKGSPTTVVVSTEGSRGRRYTILKILSNLKHFLNTAKAKFIFIAGREMYDAALADVSDRNSFIGSIFHNVIYVNSFLTDDTDDNLSDITSMTEAYVCQFLLPVGYPEEPSLKTYNRYLKKDVFNQGNVDDLKRRKIIFTLKHFITYLTYRSNGAPKNLTQSFENYIFPASREELCKTTKNLVVGRSSRNLYLRFDPLTQYTFGVITYIVNPFIFQINRDIKEFGDKLLVSMSFLVDHLYKYHGKGFSWRNLELMPEIIDINKAPQLRGLIHDIIRFLSNTHVQEIVSGLYGFKFSKKVVEEIAFLSKMSELESAAFNFTLDESLSIKGHYRRQIQQKEEHYRQYQRTDVDAQYVHTIGFLHMVLGDLHFYDEEYDLAINEYLEAHQFLRWNDRPDQSDPDLFVMYIRNELKLGLVFEQKGTLEPAITRYGKASFEVARFSQYVHDNKRLKARSFSKHKQDWYQRATVLEGVRLMYQPLVAKFAAMEKHNLGGVTTTDIGRLWEEFEFLFKEIESKDKVLIQGEFRNKVGGILFYKNGAISKERPPGEKPSSEESTNAKVRPLKEAQKDWAKSVINKDEEPCEVNEGPIYCWSTGSLCSPNRHVTDDIFKKGHHAPCRACECYMGGLRTLFEGHFNLKKENSKEENSKEESLSRKSILPDLLKGLIRQSEVEKGAAALKALARALSDAGDTFLSCASKKERIRVDFWKMFIKLIEAKNREGKTKYKIRLGVFNCFVLEREKVNKSGREAFACFEGGLSKIEEVLFYYYLSALYFKRAGEDKQYALQLIRILYVIRDYFSTHREELELVEGEIHDVDEKPLAVNTFIDALDRHLVSRAIRGLYRAYDNTHRLEVESYEQIFDEDVDLNSISISADLREVLIAFYELKMRLQPSKIENLTISDRSISAYAVSNSVYNRIIELRFKGRIYERMFKHFHFDLVLDLPDISRTIKAIKDHINKNPGAWGKAEKIHDDLGLREQLKESRLGGRQKKLVRSQEERAKAIKLLIDLSELTTQKLNAKQQVKSVEKEGGEEAIEKSKKNFDELEKKQDALKDKLKRLRCQGVWSDDRSLVDEIQKIKQEIGEEGNRSKTMKDLVDNLKALEEELEKLFLYAEVRTRLKEYQARLAEATEPFNATVLKQELKALEKNRARLEEMERRVMDWVKGFLELFLLGVQQREQPEEPVASGDTSGIIADPGSIKADLDLFIEHIFEALTELRGEAIQNINLCIDRLGLTDEEALQGKRNAVLEFAKDEIRYWPDEQVRLCFEDKARALMQFLITDAMFSLHTLVYNFRIYGASHMNTHSLLATTYARLATWCRRYETYREVCKKFESKTPDEKIQDRLEGLMKEADRQALKYEYNGEMALRYYRYAIEIHNEGKAYKSALKKMFYLNDDFNDAHYHFSAAIERYWINSGVTVGAIRHWMDELAVSEFYRTENYQDNA